MATFLSGIRTQPRTGRRLERIPLDQITESADAPRTQDDTVQLQALADSIRQHGLLVPLLVRPCGERQYSLIAGSRRLRALRLLNAVSADALVIQASDRNSLLMALVENLQRAELHFFDEAEAYRILIERYGMRQDALAERVGRSPSAVANRLRLLKLSPAVRKAVLESSLTERHARALLRLSDESAQLHAIQEITEKQLNVARTEALIESLLHTKQIVPGPTIRLLLRSRRLFVNTVMDTVNKLNGAGLNCVSRVEETPERIEIILSLEQAVPQTNIS